jgi:two-component system chemotaxis response regulator CheB
MSSNGIGGGNLPRIAGLVASTGGPRAVETVLQAVGGDFPLPIVLVQHLTAGFHSGFVAWLDRAVPQTVKEACHGEVAKAGHVYVAPADAHLTVRGDRLALDSSEPVSGQRPSGTVLFQSMAETVRAQGIGVLLTGMGDDGADGLLALRGAGGFTIAEDESTAVVNGMPQVARNLGAACASLPLDSVGPALKSLALVPREVCA